MTKVAFQGEHGAYSEEAIRQHFGPEVETLPCEAFEHIFAAVDRDEATFGVQPVENSLAGSINKAYDLLLEHDLKVHGEIVLRVRHCLLTLPGQTQDIQQVRSHPQALAQCEGFLNRHGYKAIPWYDTAGSAKELAENPAPNVGVIASKLSAQTYGLEVVQEGIEDLSFNYTRFSSSAKEKRHAPKTPRPRWSLRRHIAPARSMAAWASSPTEPSTWPKSRADRAATDLGSTSSTSTLRATGKTKPVARRCSACSTVPPSSNCWAASLPPCSRRWR